jgi:hypothetical protein
MPRRLWINVSEDGLECWPPLLPRRGCWFKTITTAGHIQRHKRSFFGLESSWRVTRQRRTLQLRLEEWTKRPLGNMPGTSLI